MRLKKLASLLARKKQTGHRIFLISDEAYSKLFTTDKPLPDVFNLYEDTLSVYSHSKDLGLAGERIGYIAVSPGLPNRGR